MSKDYMIELEVNGGQYKSYMRIRDVQSVDTIDPFTILINDEIKVELDERFFLKRLMK